MTTRRIPLTVVIATVACFVWGPAVFAHSSIGSEKAGNLQQLVEQSNLVVVGEVVSVKYVNAKVEGEGDVPHTIVTYKLRDSLRGKPSGETLSLRFIGGADGQGGFLTVSGVPQFQEGEQDILFVSGNGEDESCPLVNCEYGRFRLHQNRVFNTHGQPVRGIVKNNAVARGRRGKPFETFKYPTPEFDELMKNAEAQAVLKKLNMSIEDARKEYRAKAPKEIVVTRGGPPPSLSQDQRVADRQDRGVADPQAEGRNSGGKPEVAIGKEPITADHFLAKIKELRDQAKRQPTAVNSANPNAPIVLKKAGPAAARKPEDAPEPKQQTAEEEEELRALKSQDFNPVLKKKK